MEVEEEEAEERSSMMEWEGWKRTIVLGCVLYLYRLLESPLAHTSKRECDEHDSSCRYMYLVALLVPNHSAAPRPALMPPASSRRGASRPVRPELPSRWIELAPPAFDLVHLPVLWRRVLHGVVRDAVLAGYEDHASWTMSGGRAAAQVQYEKIPSSAPLYGRVRYARRRRLTCRVPPRCRLSARRLHRDASLPPR